MKKRLLSLLLALVMILGMIPATSLTANAASVKDEISIIRLVGPKNGRYLDFECGVSLLGVKVDGIRWVDHTAGEKYEIAYPGTHEPVEVVAGHEYRVVIFMSTTDGSVFPDPSDITASIPGASSVSAGRVGGEGADTVCVTGYFTATQGDSDIIGVQASGDGYYWNKEKEAVLYLYMDSQAFLYDDYSIGPVEGTQMGSLYTDQALTKPATSMEMGETYYFEYTLWHKSGEVNKVEDYYSSLDFEGFSNGTVIKTTTGGNNNITMLCSIVYGDMNVDKVEAVGTGYGYDSEKGAYAPTFRSIKAYNADGIEFDCDGFTWSTPFYTKSSFSSANKLTSEPQNGETYYFGIYIDQYLDGMSYGYTGALELMDNSVVTLPGFDVECVGFMEREMGSYLELTYAATKKGPDVYVGGVGMYDGDYLAVGATATQTTKPSGGYAYYEDGKLTLNNYSYEGKGYLYQSILGDDYAVIYSKNDLTLELIGNNTLNQTDSDSEMIYADGANLTVGGDGKLTGTSRGYALRADKDITINGGTVEVSAYSTSILSWGDVIINGGDIVAESVDRMGIYANDITINGGDVTAIGGYEAIDYGSSCSFTVAENLKIQASTTVDGELGEYVAANHDRYKKIVVRPAPDVYVGGVGMCDGDYLAVGATKTQTTKPYGGYAYYKNGTLTLNNYSYEGEGYRLGAVYIDGTDLTIELLGDNTLVQTKSGRDAICAENANLTIGGTGNLTCRGEDNGIWVGEGLTINGGTITAIGNIMAIRYNSSYGCNVADGLTIQASTTADGALGKYVAANHNTYKKIVIKTPDVYVGGVGMYDGDYLAVGATTTRTTKPSGGYAYYKDGKLTLNNYSYEGKGYLYNSSKRYYAVIYSKNDLTLELIGSNTLIQTAGLSHTIYVSGASLIVGGTGSLTNTDDGYGFYADQDITINSGTIHSTGHFTGIRSEYGSVVINSGDVTAIGNSGIRAQVKFVANGGTITATCRPNSSTCAIHTEGSVVFASDMTVQASTTVDGELGEYVAANHDSYKKIVIKPDASNITVNCIGDIDYTVSGNVVTVDHEVACKVGYLDGTAYKAITAVANGDGTYSFTAPAGVTEVLLVVKGDVSGDGRINVGDTAKTYSHVRGTAKLTDPIAIFAADVTGDSKINVGDTAKIYSHVKGTSKLTW